MIKFENVKNGRLHLSVNCKTCELCQSAMIGQYSPLYRVIGKTTILYESSIREGVCYKCYKLGGFNEKCSICKGMQEYPSSFKYETITYPSYRDDESKEDRVCLSCVNDKSGEVITLLASVDETATIQ